VERGAGGDTNTLTYRSWLLHLKWLLTDIPQEVARHRFIFVLRPAHPDMSFATYLRKAATWIYLPVHAMRLKSQRQPEAPGYTALVSARLHKIEVKWSSEPIRTLLRTTYHPDSNLFSCGNSRSCITLSVDACLGYMIDTA